jgi:hypothetical protein
MNHLNAGRQHLVDSISDDRVRLPAAHFHDLPRPCGDLVNLTRHALRNFAIPELG